MAIQVWPVMFGIAIRSSKSQKWNTAIEKSGSGRMRSNTYQLLPTWSISIKYAWLTDENYRTIMGFVALLKGAHKPFWWFSNTYTVNGGTITFRTAPASGAVVTASYRYYWKVHLPDDGISIDHVFTNLKQTGTIKFESWR